MDAAFPVRYPFGGTALQGCDDERRYSMAQYRPRSNGGTSGSQTRHFYHVPSLPSRASNALSSSGSRDRRAPRGTRRARTLHVSPAGSSTATTSLAVSRYMVHGPPGRDDMLSTTSLAHAMYMYMYTRPVTRGITLEKALLLEAPRVRPAFLSQSHIHTAARPPLWPLAIQRTWLPSKAQYQGRPSLLPLYSLDPTGKQIRAPRLLLSPIIRGAPHALSRSADATIQPASLPSSSPLCPPLLCNTANANPIQSNPIPYPARICILRSSGTLYVCQQARNRLALTRYVHEISASSATSPPISTTSVRAAFPSYAS